MIARATSRSILALSAALLSLDCSTVYEPRRSGQVGVVIHHAGAMYVKDGQQLPIGPFNGELPGLVGETPAAVVHARRAHTQFIVGVPVYLGGAVGVVLGVLLLSGPVGWIVIGAGASSMATGLSFLGAGLTNVVDAVNIHNDSVRYSPVDGAR